MKNISTILIFIFFFISCKNESNSITESDVNFVNHLQNKNKANYLQNIDSVLIKHDKNKAISALLYLKKGTLLSQLNRYEKAIENLTMALPFFKTIENKEYVTTSYWLLGSANAFLSNTAIANNQLLTALQYSIESKDKKSEAKIYGSLAQVQYISKDYARAIEYTKKSIAIYSDLNFTLGLSSAYNNLAVVYKNIGDYPNSLLYNTKSLDLNIQEKDTAAIAQSYNNIGNVYSKLQQDAKAISHFRKAIALNKKKNILNASPLINLGDLQVKNNTITEAKRYYLQALHIENQTNNVPVKLELNHKLLEITLQEKDFENAIFHQKQSDSLAIIQTLNNEREKRTLLEDQYKLARSKQNLKIEHELNAKNKTIFFIVLALLLLLGLFGFQYFRNKTLKTEKDKLLLEQQLLRSQMNPHFIFNALSSIQNSLLDDTPMKSVKYLSRFAKLIRQNFDFVQKKSIPLFDELDALKNYLDTQKMRFEDKFNYQINLDPNIDTYQTKIPPLLLQPFVENAIEHGFKNKKDNGDITITISQGKHAILFQITDNGKGFNKAKKDNKEHAINIFKKRLKLLGNRDENSFKILSNSNGTSVKFSLSQ